MSKKKRKTFLLVTGDRLQSQIPPICIFVLTCLPAAIPIFIYLFICGEKHPLSPDHLWSGAFYWPASLPTARCGCFMSQPTIAMMIVENEKESSLIVPFPPRSQWEQLSAINAREWRMRAANTAGNNLWR